MRLMKKIVILGILTVGLLTAISSACFASTSYPPGTSKVKLKDRGVSLYVDKSPVANIDWKEVSCCFKACPEEKIGTSECECNCFQSDQKSTAMDIDSVIWKRTYGNAGQKADLRYSPITGINSKQMTIYCNIRSKLVNFKFPNKTVKYELLSENDYKQLLSEQWKYLDMESEFGEMTADGTVFYRGDFIAVQDFHGPITFRCKAILTEM